MFNRVRRHLSSVHHRRELAALGPQMRADIGWSGGPQDGVCRPILMLPLGPGDRTLCR